MLLKIKITIQHVRFKLFLGVSQGMTEKPNKANIKVIIGPKKNNIKLACVGATYSFKINFKASATFI